MKRLLCSILFVLLSSLAFAQTRPSGWVIAIGDLIAWYRGTEVQLEYSKLAPNMDSIIAAATVNYMPNLGRADIDQRVSNLLHLLCNHDLTFCRAALTDQQLDFIKPLPFGEPANPPSQQPVIPPPPILPFGQK